jgi:tetratricopeptide (TPR) repeat protein
LVEIYNNSKYLLANAALTLCQLGDSVSISYINKLIKIGRLNAQEHSVAATVLSELGMYKDAISHFEASLELKDSRDTKDAVKQTV